MALVIHVRNLLIVSLRVVQSMHLNAHERNMHSVTQIGSGSVKVHMLVKSDFMFLGSSGSNLAFQGKIRGVVIITI
jgi:hypothetical protein